MISKKIKYYNIFYSHTRVRTHTHTCRTERKKEERRGPAVVLSYEPSLEVLDPGEHVDVTSGVLFNHVLDVIGSECFAELPPGHEVADLA